MHKGRLGALCAFLRGERSGSDGGQCLLDVRNDVVDVLDAD